MDLFVPASDPEAFETGFIEAHPKLHLKETAGSGSFWSDGDGRSDAAYEDRVHYALENKVRTKSSKMRPKPREWRKALSQLKKFSSRAVRLFAVYSCPENSYTVTIPEKDLKKAGIEAEGELLTSRSELPEKPMLFDWLEWKNLYRSL